MSCRPSERCRRLWQANHVAQTALDGILKSAGITTVVVVGIAYDFCVAWTATDAVDLGYNAVIISDAAAPIGVPRRPVLAPSHERRRSPR